jgi:LacI family transcriptional regulator
MTDLSAKRGLGRAPTISDVAAEAGVSPMTVSRVINGNESVRLETRQRVEAAIAALSYAPNPAARALAGGQEMRIGLLHSNPSFAYLSAFLVGTLDQASKSNVHLVVEKCDGADDFRDALDHLIAGRVEGIVLPSPLSDASDVLAAIEKTGLPAVAIATEQAPDWALSVCVDDHRAAYDMTRHIGSLGHQRIGFITGNPNQAASAARLEGYRHALADMNLPFAPELVANGLFTYRSGLDAADQLLDQKDPPTAIFASNDDMAAASVAIAHRRGLDVPGDLTVCGFDDTALATTIWPELTTIRQPVVDMARSALDRLVHAIRMKRAGRPDESGETHIRADYTLVRRQSDAAPRRRPTAVRRDRAAR